MSNLENARVIRYLRPTSGDHSNMGGVTFVFYMDYINRTVDVRYSVCSLDDNFDKALGLEVALASDSEEFDLDDFRARADEFGGFTNYYVRYLGVKPSLTKRDRILLKFIDQVF